MDCEGLVANELQICQAARAAADAAAAAAKLAQGKAWWEVVLANLGGISTLALTGAFILGLWHFWPVLRKILETRNFTIKLAGFELTAQEATDQLLSHIKDLQDRVAALASQIERGQGAPALNEPESVAPVPGRILWVDDKPAGNAALIATFEEAGYRVEQELTTEDALGKLRASRGRYTAVISDMGRTEGGRYRGEAGMDLVRAMQAEKIMYPLAIYTSQRGMSKSKEAQVAGAGLVTTSPTELRQFILAQDH